MSLYRSNVSHSAVTAMELAGALRPNSGAGHRISGTKSAEFLLHVLKNAESNAELQAFAVASVVIEHTQVNKVAAEQSLQSSRAGQPTHGWALPPHWRCSFLRRSRLFLNQERRLHRRIRYPKRALAGVAQWTECRPMN